MIEDEHKDRSVIKDMTIFKRKEIFPELNNADR
jgi:hypothetical protein